MDWRIDLGIIQFVSERKMIQKKKKKMDINFFIFKERFTRGRRENEAPFQIGFW